MTLDSQLSEQIYLIHGKDETGLIPEGTVAVILRYEEGKVVSAYCNNLAIAKSTVGKNCKELDEIADKISFHDAERIAKVLEMLGINNQAFPNECPTCGKNLQDILDYPIVYVAKFKRVDIPADVLFPDIDPQIYSGPKIDPKIKDAPNPPEAVLDFFKANNSENVFEYEGYAWKKKGDWGTAFYLRKTLDAKPVIQKEISSYLDTLESFVGEEIPTDFLWQLNTNIPGTNYNLELVRINNVQSEQWFRTMKLIVPDIQTSEREKKIFLCITQVSGSFEHDTEYHAIVAGIAYEARLRTAMVIK